MQSTTVLCMRRLDSALSVMMAIEFETTDLSVTLHTSSKETALTENYIMMRSCATNRIYAFLIASVEKGGPVMSVPQPIRVIVQQISLVFGTRAMCSAGTHAVSQSPAVRERNSVQRIVKATNLVVGMESFAT